MQLAYTPEQEALRQELRDYFARTMPPEVVEEMTEGEMGGPACIDYVRQMAADGWLGIGWPTQYGGQGRSKMEQFIFYDEAQRAGAPVPFLTINTVGPTIMEFGTQEQKDFFLPRILRGECFFSIGYTEPGAGTDLASLTTRAVRDGDEWVITGQKIFTSLIDHADYVWLAARTDPEAPKHAGISIFIVPTSAEGFSWTPINVMGNATTSSTFYDEVRVPDSAIVGGVNNGWSLIVNQLNYERISLSPPGFLERPYLEVRRWAQQTKLADGRRVIDLEWVQLNLARVHTYLEVLRLLNWKTVWSDTVGKVNPADASATKVFGSERAYIEGYRLLTEVLGATGALRKGSAEAALAGRLERSYQGTLILTFGGGTNEIQRDLIAVFGLGLPRAIRA